ncbi:MAG TPA: hypothetical protein VE914_08305 [Candidatus Angelobacter sp.]|nr:hypothetical protein [Candidatus Angelobacter sp.]
MVNDSSSMRRWLALAGVVMVAALTAACAENRKPPVAAMVPQSTNGVFGYADKMVAPDLYEVAYVSPPLRATQAADDAHGLAGEKQRVYDLALWRAAQLAQEKKSPAFQVQHESRDVDVTVRHDPVYYPPPPIFFGPCRWDCGWPYGYWPYPYDYGYRTRAAGRITVTLTVKMLGKATADSLDTAATIERLRKAYGSATFAMTQANY